MATPSCPKCGKSGFLAWDYPVANVGTVKLICCTSCGAVVGVHNPEITDNQNRMLLMLRDLARKMGVPMRD